MDQQQQGSSYEEEEVDLTASTAKKFDIDPKYLIIGGGLLVAVILIIIVVSSLSSGSSSSVTDASLEDDPFGIADFSDDPFLDDWSMDGDDLSLFNPFIFTDEERRELSIMGMSAFEIEDAMNQNLIFQDVLEDIRERQDEYLRNRYSELRLNTIRQGSLEYQEILQDTWLANQERDLYVGELYNSYQTKREINSYRKLPVRGPQLILRMEMESGEIVFFPVSPERWEQLPDEANMVVQVSYVVYNDNEYIVEIVEIPQN